MATAPAAVAIYNLSHAGGTVKPRLINVILWGNTAATNPQVHSNALAEINVSFSVVQGGCNSIPAAICAQTNLISNPRLRPLANNGGFTKTMLVTLGSSAVNTGYLDACVKPNVNGVDQRGVSRPQGSTNQCDIGAVEVIPSELQLLFRDGFEAD